jgi:16S rRNA (uracil1498-N3)-methyltransferase
MADHRPDPELISSAAHVFVESLHDLQLSDADRHHLGRVLRLRDDEVVTVSDGLGHWMRCHFVRGDASVRSLGDIQTASGDGPDIGIAVGVPKGERLDWCVQKLTELNVARIVLLHSDHCIVRWDAVHAERHRRRLGEIARAAAMQSRRLTLPSITTVTSLDELIEQGDVCVAVFDAEPLGPRIGAGTVAVGPEGGWSRREIEQIERRAVETASLGSTVLRTETAALFVAIKLADRAAAAS